MTKIHYDIDVEKGIIFITDYSSVLLESFIMTNLRSDNRNWSNVYNILSGRIQTPSRQITQTLTEKNIPDWPTINNYIKHLESHLLRSKS